MLHACPFQGNPFIQTLLSATTSVFPEVHAYFFPTLYPETAELLTFPVVYIMKYETKVLEMMTRNRQVTCTELHENQDFLWLLYNPITPSRRHILNKTSFETDVK